MKSLSLKKSLIVAAVGGLAVLSSSAPAFAAKGARIPGRSGFPVIISGSMVPLSTASTCFVDHNVAIGVVVYNPATCTAPGGTARLWVMPIPTESTGVARSINGWINLFASTPVTYGRLETYTYDGLYYNQHSVSTLSTGEHAFTTTVPAGGYGVLYTSMNTAGQAVRSYVYEYNYP